MAAPRRASESPVGDGPRVGRPRDPGRDEAILAATLQLLGEVSYDQVTVRAIATRAQVGLATMYRRWPTKEELVVDAILSYEGERFVPDPGVPARQAAGQVLGALSELMQGALQRLIPNLLGQLPRNPELAELLRTRLILPRLSVVGEQLARVPGVRPDQARPAAELVAGWIFFQVLVLGQRVTRAEVDRMLDVAIAVGRGDAELPG
jgi:AcrR family transcriptional regulator